MLQANHILVVDSDAASQAALEQATRLAIACGASLSVVTVVSEPISTTGPGASAGAAQPATSPEAGSAALESWRSAVACAVQKAAQDCDAVPPPLVTVAPVSSADAALRHIADASVDLVVGDTPADRGAIPVLASDPIATITRRADVPVFVVEHRSIQTPIRRILVPTDFSEHARGAFEHAKALARLYNASLDVLHVLERPQYVALNTTDMLAMSDATLTERKARRRAETFAASVNGEPVSTRVHVRHGDAADCIGHFMDETPIDLVVLSTHGVIGRPTHPFGSVVEKVLRRVAHPVFLTRAFGGSVVESLRSASGSDGAVGSTPSVDPKLP